MEKTRFEPDVSWLKDCSIKSFDFKNDKLTVFYSYKQNELFDEIKMGESFKPFLYIGDPKAGKFNQIRHTTTFSNLRSWRKISGRNALGFSPETQFLIQSKKNLYDNMALADNKIMVIDLETTSLDPKYGKIIAIGIRFNKPMADGKTEIILREDASSEKKMLGEFIQIVKEKNPDIIANHNIFCFDLPYLEGRFLANEIPPMLGRNDFLLYKDYGTTKVHRMIQGNEFFQYRIPGRNVVDTMHLAMIEDTRRNEFENYKLKYLASELEIAPEDRVYLEPEEIKELYYKKHDNFDRYLLNDLEEAMGLVNMFLPSVYQTCKLVPIQLQNMVYSGATKKATSLFSRDYYHAEKPIPMPNPKRKFDGAISKAREQGVFFNVHKYDVSSLYPSIMEIFEYYPKSDELGVFEKYLKFFKKERLKYKKLTAEEEEKIEAGTGSHILKEEYDAYQLAFKIFINSFYGILGNEFFPWNDYDMAEAVTSKGRETLMKMISVIGDHGCKIIQLDTDGVYFASPDGLDAKELLDTVNDNMVKGIKVDFEKSFKSFFSYKGKTYAAMYLDPNKPPLIKGSAFKSRALPPFLKKFIRNAVTYILLNQKQNFYDELFLLKRSIADQTLSVKEVAEGKNISFDYKRYISREKNGKKLQKIGYFEAMEREGRTEDFKTGDKVYFYIGGNEILKQKNEMTKIYVEGESVENDYNADTYIEKLNSWEASFKEYI